MIVYWLNFGPPFWSFLLLRYIFLYAQVCKMISILTTPISHFELIVMLTSYNTKKNIYICNIVNITAFCCGPNRKKNHLISFPRWTVSNSLIVKIKHKKPKACNHKTGSKIQLYYWTKRILVCPLIDVAVALFDVVGGTWQRFSFATATPSSTV